MKYNTGEAVVGRILNSNSDVQPIGLLDNSLSVINYSKNKYLAISIGGSDENSITNQIYSFDINKNVLKKELNHSKIDIDVFVTTNIIISN